MQPHYKRVQQAHARLRLLEDAERLARSMHAYRKGEAAGTLE